MLKPLAVLLSISTGACATLPIRPPPPSLPPPPPIAVVPPAECMLAGDAAPVFTPRPLPPKAADGSDVLAVLTAERDRALAALDQAVSHADAVRVWAANKHDRDVRCADWTAGLNK